MGYKKYRPEPIVLFQAVDRGDYAETKRLIEEGHFVDAQFPSGFTMLMGASWKGYTDIAKLLIEAGADVSAQDDDGCTALMFASIFEHTDIADLLRKAGAIK